LLSRTRLGWGECRGELGALQKARLEAARVELRSFSFRIRFKGGVGDVGGRVKWEEKEDREVCGLRIIV